MLDTTLVKLCIIQNGLEQELSEKNYIKYPNNIDILFIFIHPKCIKLCSILYYIRYPGLAVFSFEAAKI